MRHTAISLAIERLLRECSGARRIDRFTFDGLERSAAWWILAASSPAHPSGTPPVGSSGPRAREGNSTLDPLLVAGISNCLTLDAQRENAGIPHYGNRSREKAGA